MIRSLLVLLLALSALPAKAGAPRAGAAVVVEALSPGAPVRPPPPLLVGSVADPRSPLSVNLTDHALRLGSLDAAQIVSYLTPLVQTPTLDGVSAGLLTLSLARPEAARPLLEANPTAKAVLSRPRSDARALSALPAKAGAPAAIDQLALTARENPTVAAVFDGVKPSLEIDRLAFKGNHLVFEGKKIPRLGSGLNGHVDVHPLIPGAVIKTVDPDIYEAFFQAVAGIDPQRLADGEEQFSRRLAEAGAGPRYLGRGHIQGAEVSVRERIYGETLDQLVRARRFGAEEYALLEELLDDLARARLHPNEFKTFNIMIGYTRLNPKRRGYIVDGGRMLPVPESMSAQALRDILAGDELLTGDAHYDPYVGVVAPSKPFKQWLDEALARSKGPSFWESAWKALSSWASR